MPDVRLNPVTNDLKPRNPIEQNAPDLSGSQFLETMLAGVTASSDDKYNERRTEAAPKTAEPVKSADKADKASATNDIKAKIKARLKEMADKDPSPVKDTKALKTLQKVAKFLVKADEEGKIDLPPALVQNLQEFLAKGDDLKAFDIANFMTDFADVFRGITVQLGAQTPQITDGEALKWPAEIVDSFKNMDLAGLAAQGDKPLSQMDVLRGVKALVNESQKSAIKTLDENAQAGLSEADPASLLLGGLKAPIAEETAEPIATDVAAAKTNATTKATQAALLSLNELPKTALPPELAQKLANQAKPAQPSLTKLMMDKAFPAKEEKPADKAIETKAVVTDKPAENVLKTATSVSTETQAAEQIILPTPHLDAKFADTHTTVFTGVTGLEASSINANLTGAKAVMQNAAVQSLSNATGGTPMQQVIVHMQSKMNKSSQMSIQMTPAELGQVDIRLETSSDGKTRAVVMVEKPETLALLQKDAMQLERALQQAGLNADARDMSFNLRDQHNAQQFGQQGRKRFNREAIGDISGTEIAIPVTGAGQIFSDTQINYHA